MFPRKAMALAAPSDPIRLAFERVRLHPALTAEMIRSSVHLHGMNRDASRRPVAVPGLYGLLIAFQDSR
jgi:hypothetical protein